VHKLITYSLQEDTTAVPSPDNTPSKPHNSLVVELETPTTTTFSPSTPPLFNLQVTTSRQLDEDDRENAIVETFKVSLDESTREGGGGGGQRDSTTTEQSRDMEEVMLLADNDGKDDGLDQQPTAGGLQKTISKIITIKDFVT
jgi:hypothetical protein